MKKIYKSKTVWFNFILLALAMFDKEFFTTIGMSEAMIPKVQIILVKICAIGNLALRYFGTSEKLEPVSFSDKDSNGLALIIGIILAI